MFKNTQIFFIEKEIFFLSVSHITNVRYSIMTISSYFDSLFFFIDSFQQKQAESQMEFDLWFRFFNILSSVEGQCNIFFFRNFKLHSFFFLQYFSCRPEFKVVYLEREARIYLIRIFFKDKFFIISDAFSYISYNMEKGLNGFNKFRRLNKFQVRGGEKSRYKEIVIKKLDEIRIFLKKNIFFFREMFLFYNNFLVLFFQKNSFLSLTIFSFNFCNYVKDFFSFAMKRKLSWLTEKQELFLRESYFCGVAGIYKPFGENLVLLDCISMYSSIMKNYKVGVCQPEYFLHFEDVILYDFCNKYKISFIKVIVDVSIAIKYPLLCFRDAVSSQLMQPAGKFITLSLILL